MNSLGKWNVIMYANGHAFLTLVANKLDRHHFSMLFQWDKKIELFLNVNLKKLCQKLSVNSGNHKLQDSLKN